MSVHYLFDYLIQFVIKIKNPEKSFIIVAVESLQMLPSSKMLCKKKLCNHFTFVIFYAFSRHYVRLYENCNLLFHSAMSLFKFMNKLIREKKHITKHVGTISVSLTWNCS